MPCLLHHLQNFYLMKLHIIEISKDHSLLAHEDYVLDSSSRCVKLNFFSNLSWVFYSTTKKATNKGEKPLKPNVVIEILHHHCWYQYKCCPSEVIQNNHFQKQYINFFWTFCIKMGIVPNFDDGILSLRLLLLFIIDSVGIKNKYYMNVLVWALHNSHIKL